MNKKILSLVACAVLFMAISVQAQQGKWIGTVKYKLTYEGAVSPQAPTEYEIKVYENKGTTGNAFVKAITNATAKSITTMFDLSSVPVDGVQGKWYTRKKVTDEDMNKVTYVFTGNTKQMAGKTVKEVHVTYKDDDDEEKQETIWACDEIGPVIDLMFYLGLKGMPFEFTAEGQGVVVKYEVVELTPNNVKETEVLLESGYEEVTEEELQEMVSILNGGGEDDI
ncbi:MAG: hypothetical protein LBO06_03190 [Bacteroidales bacterium]|jgi:hypothetical protein|nr:hypothetical protein [Bacteroidales bacterium]